MAKYVVIGNTFLLRVFLQLQNFWAPMNDSHHLHTVADLFCGHGPNSAGHMGVAAGGTRLSVPNSGENVPQILQFFGKIVNAY